MLTTPLKSKKREKSRNNWRLARGQRTSGRNRLD
jgi:hypothetical protein